MDDTVDNLHQRKRDLVQRHNQVLRARSLITSERTFHITLTQGGYLSEKPCTPAKLFESLLPIHCTSLAPGAVHYHRVLRGTLIVQPSVMNAAHSVLEDETGEAVTVSFYNFVPDRTGFLQSQHAANSLFSLGTKIAIAEPYYKYGNADGSLFVRVDHFAKDVIFLEQLGPRRSEGWRQEGKDLFQKQHLVEAIFSYRRSIDTHVHSNLAAVLLSNIASALLSKRHFNTSLLFSVASIVVDGSMFRPYYTAGFTLNKLNRSDLAVSCLEQCRKFRAPQNFCRQLVAQLGSSPRVHVPASKWNADVLGLMASENVHHLLNIKAHDADNINSLELKEKGNELFKKKKVDQSIQIYSKALRGIPEVATLLINRAICYSRLGNHVQAALHASAAILITPSLSKAHYWKAMSLLQLGQKREAQACCKTALAIVGDNVNLKGLLQRAELSLQQSGMRAPRRPGSQKALSEREQEELLQGNTVSASNLARLNSMLEVLNMTGRNPSNILGFQTDGRVSPFHLEFSYEGKWPLGCDVQASMEALATAYENARAPSPLLLKELINKKDPEPEDVFKRLHSFAPNVLNWWSRAPIGSLSPRVRRPYESSALHSFTNSPCRENILAVGTVHVSVGFTDLNELLFCQIIPSADHRGLLRWIGYEGSAYSVAKAIVITQMISQQSDTDEILQVWYSSSWSEKTLCSFRKALMSLVDSTNGNNSVQYPAKVVSLWHHWQQADVSLRTARSEWLSRHSYCNQVEIANFRRKMDRIALCRYVVSGELLEGTHGSVVMFGLPAQTDGEDFEISLDEWFLHCLSLYDILDECDYETNVIEAAIGILQKRISKLKECMHKGIVEIEVRCKLVTPNDEMTQVEIRNLSPQSMSWNNLCDYYANEEFHRMARACSGEDTIHYLYSMNWSTEVKGAHLMDYSAEQHRDMLDDFNEAIAALYRVKGVIQYLHAPPITNAYNVAQHVLGLGIHDVWTDNFFTAANLDRKQTQVAVIEPLLFDVLGRGQSTVYMVFTFSPDISCLGPLPARMAPAFL